MFSYYTLKNLISELQIYVSGATIVKSLTPRRDVLEVYIKNGNEWYRIVIDTGNNFMTFFLDEYRPEKRTNTLHFFEHIQESQIIKLEVAKNDRLIKIFLNNDDQLVIKLYSSQANVFLVRDSTIVEAFKNENAYSGKSAPEPSPAVLWQLPGEERSTKKRIQRINPLLPREWLQEIIEWHSLSQKTDSELISFVKRLADEMEKHPEPRILQDDRFCVIPENILPLPVKQRFDTLNEGIRTTYYQGISNNRYQDSKTGVLKKLESTLAGLQKQLKELQDAGKNLERADRYEKTGHLLMANLHQKVDPHAGEIQVADIYHSNEVIKIPLKAGLDLPGNAQYYYDKAKKSRKSYEMAMKRIDTVKEDIARMEALLSELSEVEHHYELQKWMKRHKDVLETAGWTESSGKARQHPFRKMSAGEYELWVGKNAKSNDSIMNFAHKEDIWLHARGVSGSHVVIRMNNDKNFPAREIILKAASIAAYYSKAKGSKMAPVSFTKKKFVRKAKGAAPGLVYLDREEVVMAEPAKS